MPRGRPRGSVGVAVDKPRGRMTAYAFFVQTCREEHKKLHPEETVSFSVFSKQCSDRWKTMSPIEKEKFHDMASKDKERYNEEMKGYTGPTGRRGRRPRGMKKMKDPNKPKRALSAFFYYANEERPNVRAANPDFSVGEVAKELGRQWAEMNETDKSKYEKLAEDDRARYDAEMVEYRKNGSTPNKRQKIDHSNSNGHCKTETVVEQDDDEEEDDEGSDEDDDDDGSEEEEEESE